MRRLIDKIWYKCIDVGCDDFEAAKESRRRQRNKYYLIWWLWYENFIKLYPRNKPLPDWSIGELPTINKSERGSINQYGIYEIGEDGLIKVDKQNHYREDKDE